MGVDRRLNWPDQLDFKGRNKPVLIVFLTWHANEEHVCDSKDNLINVFHCILSLLDAAADQPEPPPQTDSGPDHPTGPDSPPGLESPHGKDN